MKKIEMMALPYAVDALEPVISKQTLEFHHGKHLAGYVNNLNGLLPRSGFEEMTLEEIVCKASGGMLNNAGQILNHNLYFGQFCASKADNRPTGKLAEALEREFGSFEAFKEAFQKAGATLFGSGWVWLSADKDGKFVITQEVNAANPVQKGLKLQEMHTKEDDSLFYYHSSDDRIVLSHALYWTMTQPQFFKSKMRKEKFFLLLRQYEEEMLDARSARAVANVFGKALTTKGDMPLKVGKPDYDKMLAMVDDEQYERN